jgi:hypothetical protein
VNDAKDAPDAMVAADRRAAESQVPSPSEIRRAALETLIIESIVKLVAVPFVVLAIFGFGAFPRNIVNVWSTGGPPVVPLWRSLKKRRHTRKPDSNT